MTRFELLNLSQILKNSLGDEIKLEEQDVDILTEPGEHYGSLMLKVNLRLQMQNELRVLHLVAKLIPVSELLQRAFDVQVTFKKEAFTYSVTIPTLLQFQQEFNVPRNELLDCFVKCYGARNNLEGDDKTVDKNAIILFENLRTEGYESIDRHLGCDLETANIILINLAKFHAIPLALRRLQPKLFETKVKPALIPSRGADMLDEEVKNVFHNSIINVASQCNELSTYLDKIKKLDPSRDKLEPNEYYSTMCHSDAWTSNIMILRNSDNVPEKIKLIDFQLTKLDSGIRDLVFFLFTSVQNDILEQNFDHFVKLYYDIFLKTMNFFGVDLEPYSWKNFNKELERVAPTEVYHILFMLKVIFSERGKITNTIDKFEVSDWTREDLLGENHKRKLKDTVLALVSKKWI